MIKKIPIPICGVILGMYGLGNLLQSYSEGIRMVCGAVATILLILFVISVCSDFGKFMENLKNPIMASVFCTFPMALMLLATYYKPWLGAVSAVIWYAAIVLYVVMIVYFTAKFILKLDMTKVFASYFIVYVGIAMAAMTAPAFEATGIGTAAFWFGFISLIVLLVLVTVRYVKLPAPPNPAKPLICIYSAPASLCIAGYVQSVMPKSLPLLKCIWVVATILFVFALIKFVQYLKLPFFPSYASYTFPFVIGAIASKQLMACAAKMEQPMPFLKPIVLAETIIAAITTLYALVRYIMFLLEPEKKEAHIS